MPARRTGSVAACTTCRAITPASSISARPERNSITVRRMPARQLCSPCSFAESGVCPPVAGSPPPRVARVGARSCVYVVCHRLPLPRLRSPNAPAPMAPATAGRRAARVRRTRRRTRSPRGTCTGCGTCTTAQPRRYSCRRQLTRAVSHYQSECRNTLVRPGAGEGQQEALRHAPVRQPQTAPRRTLSRAAHTD